MKWLLGILLAANLTLFAVAQWGGAGAGKAMQPQADFNAEKIRQLEIASMVQATDQSACMEWGEFSGNDLARASAALTELKLPQGQLTQRQLEHPSGYWVYIPPLKTRAEADKKVAQIKSLGLEDYYLVQDEGKWQNAISLGIFKTADAAQKFLDDIRIKGVRSAIMGERSGKPGLTVFVLKNPDTALTAKIVALQSGFPGSELKAAACTD